jgi:uncharacterized repeat protein (TIGR01451 family)
VNTKRLISIALVMLATALTLSAQEESAGIVIKYPQSTISFHVRPGAADATTLPFLQAKAGSEAVGVLFEGIPDATPVIELLDAQQKLIRSVSAGELMGKSAAGGVQLTTIESPATGNRALAAYAVPTPQGPITLVLRGVASADKSTAKNPATFALTFAAKSKSVRTIGLRLHLPVQGTVEARENGFAVSGKTAAAFTALISPRPEKVEYANRSVTITTKATAIAAGNIETPLTWFIVEGMNAANAAASKAEASKMLADDAKTPVRGPNIVIVTYSNKQTTAPGDTVAYSVVCSNIGSGGAKDIEVSNPIPAGTRYIAGSAAGDQTTISTDAPSGAVSLIRWKLQSALQPGQERIVSFKVIVQ